MEISLETAGSIFTMLSRAECAPYFPEITGIHSRLSVAASHALGPAVRGSIASQAGLMTEGAVAALRAAPQTHVVDAAAQSAKSAAVDGRTALLPSAPKEVSDVSAAATTLDTALPATVSGAETSSFIPPPSLSDEPVASLNDNSSPARPSLSHSRHSISPRRRSRSPIRRHISPRRRSISPRRRSISPNRRSISPRRRSVSPRRRSPNRQFAPQARRPSPRRSPSPRGRASPNSRRPPSPRGRSPIGRGGSLGHRPVSPPRGRWRERSRSPPHVRQSRDMEKKDESGVHVVAKEDISFYAALM